MEILIRVVDKGAAEDCSKAGDIIATVPNGWQWSNAELTNPDWRIVRTNILQTQADAFLAKTTTNTNHRRDWKIDFSLLPDPSLFEGPRTQGIITLTRAQIVAAAVRKP